HFAGELVRLARLRRAQELARAPGLTGGREARVDKRGGKQHRGAERHDEADRALPGGIHRLRLWRGHHGARAESSIVQIQADLDEWPWLRAEQHIKVCNKPPRNFHIATPYLTSTDMHLTA